MRLSAYVVGSRAAASLAQAAMIVLVARLTQPDSFGALSALLGVGAFLSVVFDMGLTSYALRQELRPREDPNSHHIHVLSHWLGLGAAIALFGIALFGLVQGISIPDALLIAAWIASERIGEQQIALLISDDRQRAATLLVLTRRVLPLGVFVGLVFTPLSSVTGYAISLLGGGIVGLALGYAGLRHLPRNRDGAPRTVTITRHAMPFWASSISAQARELETWFFQLGFGSFEASMYGLAYRLGKPAQVLASAVAQVMIPAATRSDRAFSRRALARIAVVSASVTVLCMCVTPFVPALVTLVVGAEYLPATRMIQITIVAAGAVAMTSPLDGIGQAAGLEKQIARFGWIAVIVASASVFICAAVGAPAAVATTVLISAYTIRNVCVWLYLWVQLRGDLPFHPADPSVTSPGVG